MTRKRTCKKRARPANRSGRTSSGTQTPRQPSSSTASAKRKAQAARLRRMRRKRIRNTILLILLLVVLCGAGGFGVYKLKGGAFSSTTNSFNVFSEFDNTLISKENQRAEGLPRISVLSPRMLIWIRSVWMVISPEFF